ncbi:MAG: hypothetical protein H8D67_22500 [Deltaproteobacteria bacterium]|nr:hypothetical protein [Deltaproteobacteria bacterium]
MVIGIPKEIKESEYRVSMLPVGVELLTQDGHTVLVEKGAGKGSGIVDDQYAQGNFKLRQFLLCLNGQASSLNEKQGVIIESEAFQTPLNLKTAFECRFTIYDCRIKRSC